MTPRPKPHQNRAGSRSRGSDRQKDTGDGGDAGGSTERYRVSLPTPDGTFTAWFTDHGLARLEFPPARADSRHDHAAPPAPEEADAAAPRSANLRAWIEATRIGLLAVLAGETPPRWPEFDLRRGTAFQRQVWAALRRIPPGQTRTYGEVARELGRPGSARAVGQACGANPVPVLIPCHRVRATGGGLGGFSGGLDWKRRLLTREGLGPETDLLLRR